MNNIELFFDNRVAVSGLSYEDVVKLNAPRSEFKQTGIAGVIRSIEGVDMSFVLVEDEPGITGISARSRDGDRYNVAVLMEKFNGGGHQAAAGARLPLPFAAAKSELIKQLTAML